MICPFCHAQMIKVRSRRPREAPDQIRCVGCQYVIFYRGVKAAS